MHVVPAQPQKLSTAGAGDGGEYEHSVPLRITRGHVVEQTSKLGRGRWSQLTADGDQSMGAVGGALQADDEAAHHDGG